MSDYGNIKNLMLCRGMSLHPNSFNCKRFLEVALRSTVANLERQKGTALDIQYAKATYIPMVRNLFAMCCGLAPEELTPEGYDGDVISELTKYHYNPERYQRYMEDHYSEFITQDESVLSKLGDRWMNAAKNFCCIGHSSLPLPSRINRAPDKNYVLRMNICGSRNEDFIPKESLYDAGGKLSFTHMFRKLLEDTDSVFPEVSKGGSVVLPRMGTLKMSPNAVRDMFLNLAGFYNGEAYWGLRMLVLQAPVLYKPTLSFTRDYSSLKAEDGVGFTGYAKNGCALLVIPWFTTPISAVPGVIRRFAQFAKSNSTYTFSNLQRIGLNIPEPHGGYEKEQMAEREQEIAMRKKAGRIAVEAMMKTPQKGFACPSMRVSVCGESYDLDRKFYKIDYPFVSEYNNPRPMLRLAPDTYRLDAWLQKIYDPNPCTDAATFIEARRRLPLKSREQNLPNATAQDYEAFSSSDVASTLFGDEI